MVAGDALGNCFRPLSRQVYFAALAPIAHGSPRVFHAVNFTLFLACVALVVELLLAFVPLLAALASKESALALPVVFVAWDAVIAGRPLRRALARAAPHLALAALWGLLAVRVSTRASGTHWLHFDPGSFAAALVHGAQSLLGLDHPAGVFAALIAHGPDPLALALIAAIALLLPGTVAQAPRRRAAAPFRADLAAGLCACRRPGRGHLELVRLHDVRGGRCPSRRPRRPPTHALRLAGSGGGPALVARRRIGGSRVRHRAGGVGLDLPPQFVIF